jgi:hypothetical protein
MKRSGVGFGGVDLRVLFIPSCLGYTDLICVLDRSDRSEPFVGFASGELLNLCVFGLCWCCQFLAVLGCFLFRGLEKSLRLSGTSVVRLL